MGFKLSCTYYEKQTETWQKIQASISNPNEVIQSFAIALLVKDPRLILPKKKSFNKTHQQRLDQAAKCLDLGKEKK
jgi:hypothetical protein